MRFATLAAALLAPSLVSAAPTLRKRASDNDKTVLSAYQWHQKLVYLLIQLVFFYVEFAEVLEQLETEFYNQALNKFKDQDFKDAGISIPNVAIQNFQAIAAHEKAHTQL